MPLKANHNCLLRSSSIKSGSGRPNTEKVGTVTRAQLEEIAKTKEPDLTAADMDAAVNTIAGSARSMGLKVEGSPSMCSIQWCCCPR